MNEQIRKGFDDDNISTKALSVALTHISTAFSQRYLLPEEVWLIMMMPNRFTSLLYQYSPRNPSEIQCKLNTFREVI
jgi:hypothetical protein